MPVRALALAVALAGCGGGSSGPGHSPSPPAVDNPAPPERPVPELVRLPPDAEHPPPTDCTASGPSAGLLDRTAPIYRRIEYRENAQYIEERAQLRDAATIVTAQLGGCAHFGASYNFSFPVNEIADERPARLRRGLAELERLALRDGARSYRDDIIKTISARLDAGTLDDECAIRLSEMDSVHCDVVLEEERVVVRFAYDIAL